MPMLKKTRTKVVTPGPNKPELERCKLSIWMRILLVFLDYLPAVVGIIVKKKTID